MLVVTVEIWPYGEQSARRELATVEIANDGAGGFEVGSYRVVAQEPRSPFSKGVSVTAHVHDHPRMQPVLALLEKALTAVMAEHAAKTGTAQPGSSA